MLEINDGAERILDVRLNGTLDRSDIERLESEFDKRLSSQGHMSLLFDMTEWSDITGDALVKDARMELGLTSRLGHFDRIAIVSDKQIMSALTQYFDPVFPQVEIRTFSSKSREDAFGFVSAPLAERPAKGPGVVLMDSAKPDRIEFKLDGYIGNDDLEPILAKLQSKLAENDKIDLLAVISRYDGFDPSVLSDKLAAVLELDMLRKILRYAIVGGPNWIRSLGSSVYTMLPIEMKTFDAGQEAAARSWLDS